MPLLARARRWGDPATVRAAWWAATAARSTRRQLAAGPLERLRVPAPPALPAEAGHGVGAVLRRTGDTCLVRTAVRQAWHAAQGSPRDLVIGVRRGGGEDFAAHAWLEGDEPSTYAGYAEISRRPAAAAAPAPPLAA